MKNTGRTLVAGLGLALALAGCTMESPSGKVPGAQTTTPAVTAPTSAAPVEPTASATDAPTPPASPSDAPLATPTSSFATVVPTTTVSSTPTAVLGDPASIWPALSGEHALFAVSGTGPTVLQIPNSASVAVTSVGFVYGGAGQATLTVDDGSSVTVTAGGGAKAGFGNGAPGKVNTITVKVEPGAQWRAVVYAKS